MHHHTNNNKDNYNVKNHHNNEMIYPSYDDSNSSSTSKLTFENLMLHQQNLASSRSCTNLLANFHNGPSVVERNARIIKWLFNCRKAMDHQSTII
ncbi:hypothetical protein DERF_003300 [Dermatophagoides farinae]|uniref:Centrosome-associated FAM110 C-terminal domain-containing protein n=1 Tax=Dermatophagoides farinae TaxID=6954 RepID=A0A922IDE6_DERFA|nr:hypothetical protein DERF_003300 [Dermatophagoides farinae]